MKTGNPCKLHRGEEGAVRAWGPQARSGDVGAFDLLGAFWGAVSLGFAAGPGSKASWKGCLQSLRLAVPGSRWLWSSAGEGWDTAEEYRSATLVTLQNVRGAS